VKILSDGKRSKCCGFSLPGKLVGKRESTFTPLAHMIFI